MQPSYFELIGFGPDGWGKALLAAHHGEQVGVERRVPVPRQADLREGTVERLPV